jgi:hypothetical protein
MSLKCEGQRAGSARGWVTGMVDAVYDEEISLFSVVDFHIFFLFYTKTQNATPKFLEKSSRDYKVKNIFISLCGVSPSSSLLFM